MPAESLESDLCGHVALREQAAAARIQDAVRFAVLVGEGRHTVKKGKDPDGYPGDEAVRKAFGQAVRQIRTELGLTRKEAAHLWQKEQENGDARIYYRALALRLRAARTMRKMTRPQLAEAANVPVRLITTIERQRAKDVCMGDIIRLCLGMRYDVGEFMDDIHKLSLKLEAQSKL